MEKTTRKVVKRSPARTVVMLNFPGLLDHPVEAESSFEKDFICKAALCQGLTDLRHQPFKIRLRNGGYYTPDFLAVVDGAHCVVEVKLRSKISKYHDTFDEAAQQLQTHGLRFYVVHEGSLRRGAVHVRAAHILRYGKAVYPAVACRRALDCMASSPLGIPIGVLRARADTSNEVILHLLARRAISIGPELHLDDEAMVFPFRPLEMSNEDQFGCWFGVAPWGKDAGAGA